MSAAGKGRPRSQVSCGRFPRRPWCVGKIWCGWLDRGWRVRMFKMVLLLGVPKCIGGDHPWQLHTFTTLRTTFPTPTWVARTPTNPISVFCTPQMPLFAVTTPFPPRSWQVAQISPAGAPQACQSPARGRAHHLGTLHTLHTHSLAPSTCWFVRNFPFYICHRLTLHPEMDPYDQNAPSPLTMLFTRRCSF